MPARDYRSRPILPRGKVYKPQVRTGGFVRIDGQTVCRIVPERRTLQFVDRDKQRAYRRRTKFIEVSIDELARLCEDCEDSERKVPDEQA